MNTELLKRWTEETVPALCELIAGCEPYYYGAIWYRPEDYLDTPNENREEYLSPDSLDDLARVSELLGVVTAAAPMVGDVWCGMYGVNLTGMYPTEIDARLAAVIEAVAAKLKEKESDNG